MADRKIYVASSWKNKYYPEVVEVLRAAGHDVYDFRNPPKGDSFKWSNVDPNFMDWSTEEYREKLFCPKADRQFKNDLEAMSSCDTCVLVLPCGRSAHTEAGWFAGRGKRVIAYIPEKQEPDLMYRLFDAVACNIYELLTSVDAGMPTFSEIVDVRSKPKRCPICGGELWDIIYGTGSMTERDFTMAYRKSAIMGGDYIPENPPMWACPCGCRRFRKVRQDGTPVRVRIKLLDDVEPEPLTLIDFHTESTKEYTRILQFDKLHHYDVDFVTDFGESDTMRVTAVDEEDARQETIELISTGSFGLKP